MVSAVELLRMTSLLEGITDDPDVRTEDFVFDVGIQCLEVLTQLGGIPNGEVFERGRALNRAIN